MQTNNINMLLMFICLNLGMFWVIYLRRVRFLGVQTIDSKKGSDWLTRWVEAQHNIYVVKCFLIGQ